MEAHPPDVDAADEGEDGHKEDELNVDLVWHKEAQEGEDPAGHDADGDNVETRAKVVRHCQATCHEHEDKEEKVGA